MTPTNSGRWLFSTINDQAGNTIGVDFREVACNSKPQSVVFTGNYLTSLDWARLPRDRFFYRYAR